MFSVFTLRCESKAIIELKVNELRKRIIWVALASAVGGAVPIPGVSFTLDLGLMVRECTFQKVQLQIDEDGLKKLRGNISKEELESKMIGRLSVRSEYANTVLRGVGLLAMLTTQIAFSEAIESTVKIIPFLGSIAGAAISGSVSYLVQTNNLNAYGEIAQVTRDVISEMELEREKRGGKQ
jgi:uncharacterized protein (DUF697 family)